jgi:hypothetical protein
MNLYETAVAILKEANGVLDKARPKMIAALKDKNLLAEIATAYLERVLADIRAGERAPKEAIARGGKRGPHRRPKFMTDAQKAGNLRAIESVAASFLETQRIRGGRVWGEVRWHELPSMRYSSFYQGAKFLNRGLADWADAVMAEQLLDYAVPPSSDSEVRDVIKSPDAARMYSAASIEAARRIARASEAAAREALTPPPPTSLPPAA